MRYRTLGRTRLRISEVGYGAWGIGGHLWVGATDEESLAALRRSVELGLTFIDTALAYGEGHSEKLVGQLVRGTRRKIHVATKVPPKNYIWPARPGVGIGKVYPYDWIVGCTEKSLKNLGLETIALQQLHVWNPEWIGSDSWRRAFEDLKKSGKVRAVGVSINDHQPDSALELIETGLIDAVQVIYNIFDQTPETRLFPLCIKRNIGVLARVPLDEGGLTGTVDEETKFPRGDFRNSYFRGTRKKQVARRVAALQQDLAGVDGTLPEVALRFCLSQEAVTTVIPGMRKPRNVESSCAVSDGGRLGAEALAILKNHAWNRNFYD